MNIKEFLEENEKKELLRFTTAGSVDDGKSTLIGRLLHDSKNIYEDQIASVKKVSKMDTDGEDFDYALVTDGLKSEREQGITIDVAYRYFSTPKRKFIIADTPGHEQYTRNMATGASTANLAIILIDARNGVLTQSKRHTFITTLLAVPHIVVCVNKMDLMDYSKQVFDEIVSDFTDFAAKLNLKDVRFVPISALKGDNVVEPGSNNMPWYKGESLMDILETVYIASDYNLIDLRFPVQYVLRPNLDFRGYSGQVFSGIIRKGDEVTALPSGKTSRVKSIVTFDGEIDEAYPPMSVTVTLEDEIDISRGDIIVHKRNLPHTERRFEAMTVWMDEQGLDLNKPYFIKQGMQTVRGRIDRVMYRTDVNTLKKEDSDSLNLNEIGRIIFTANRSLFFDPYTKNRSTGSFILIDPITNNTAAAGMIIDREPVDKIPADMDRTRSAVSAGGKKSLISKEERQERLGQKPVTLWLTGLSASGKTDIAYALEKRIFDMGGLASVIHGGHMRENLSRELDFSPAGRAEHLRRAAEMSAFLNRSGVISICSFVSPDKKVRSQAAEVIGRDNFIEVSVDATLEYCRSREKSGLYDRADKGEIKNLAGVDLPYEKPENPAVTVKPEEKNTVESVDQILAFLRDRKIFPL
ncbi:MAG: sulfate adenylyltransferase subunit CysN [Fibrobacterota bacterium]